MTNKTPNQINVENMLSRMEEVEIQSGSSTMCLAKWLQSTVYLMNGHTHSCHHPSAHKIPISEIKANPSALHNTQHKIKVREEMLQGQRPKECQYCWNVENLPGKHVSDRTYKSADIQWAHPHLDAVIASGNGTDIAPTYLEVMFDNTCNFKCMYCTPDISSKWMEEIERFGPYPTSTKLGSLTWLKQIGKMPIPRKEENPYIDAFWQWWPSLYLSLNTFRITGGEPLLSKNTWRVLDYIKANPRKDFTIAINTNMQVPDDLIDKLITYYNDIAPNVKSFDIFTSCEAKGEQADYIRYGMNYNKFMSNCRRLLSETNARLHFMITFNALSVTTFTEFLKDIWQMRVDFNEDDADNRIPMMISYLRWPQFQDVRILPKDIKDKFASQVRAYVLAHTRNTSPDKAGRFYLEEIDQVERLCEYMYEPLDASYLQQQYIDFGNFFREYDDRRDTRFDDAFPQLTDFYTFCIEQYNG
jgi:organic radical activating enzyme